MVDFMKGKVVDSNLLIFAKKTLSVLIVLLLSLTFSFNTYAAADNADDAGALENEQVSESSDGGESSYNKYYDSASSVDNAEDDIKILSSSYVANTTGCEASACEQVGGKNAVVVETGKGSLTYNVSVPKTGRYNLSLSYAAIDGTASEIKLGIMIDGKYPFDEAENIVFPTMWQNSTNEWKTNEDGDDISPEQEEYYGEVSGLAKDNTGVAVEPYEFVLTQGNHSFTVEANGTPFILTEITLKPVEEIAAYSEVKPSDSDVDTMPSEERVVIQAEKCGLKTANVIVPKYDNSSVALTPSSVSTVKLNYLGGSWSSPNQLVEWSFDIENSGYYKIGFHFKQDTVINSETYRWLKIDGKTPFTEAKTIAFPYSTGWQFKTLSDADGEECLIWLDKGTHTLTLEATLGSMAPYYEKLSKIIESLGNLYSQIVWITGDSPDANRDYELFNAIPGFEETLKSNMEALNNLSEELSNLNGEKSTQYIASFNNMARVIRLMIEKPYIAHQYLSDYYSNYCTVSAWLSEMADMPLSLDEIQIVPHNSSFDEKDVGFFKKFAFGFKRFLYSYTNDYNTASDNEGTTLRLWVNWGRDQAQILRNLIQDSFTEETGINVNVEVVNATLIQGILSGSAPDVALQLSRAQPVNLGIRNALYDLKQFDDYDTVLERFQSGAEVPYTYDDKCYALPDTQSFYVMFYRTDIFEQFGLTVPNTWDEFILTTITLQRKNLQAYIPYTRMTSSGTVDTGVGSLNLFPTLLMQSGLSVYNEAGTASVLDSPEAISVFDDWTEFYTDYKFLKEADFYNRFRAGTIPLGIAPYSTAFTIQQTASELDGKWAMAEVPSVNGTNHMVAGSGTGCSILKTSKNIDEAWTFLKWWTSSETQVRYSKNVESVLGLVGRVCTSNIEALKQYSWDEAYKSAVLQQWVSVKEVPEIPGSYYLSRALDQAFWQVVNGKSNSIDAVTKWNEIANSEISRKLEEYRSLEE